MHNPDALFTYSFNRGNMSSENLASIEKHIEICKDCQKELLSIFGSPWLIPVLERLERKRLAASDSFRARFEASFYHEIHPRNLPGGFAYWDISDLTTLKQLLVVGQATFRLPLKVTISGGEPELLKDIKLIFKNNLSADGPRMGYQWHLSNKAAAQYKEIAEEERANGAWPQIGASKRSEFRLMFAADPVFPHAAIRHDIVIFLPEDKDELKEHWKYYFGSWVMMVWEEYEGARQIFIDQLLSIREEELERPLQNQDSHYDERYFPWLFRIDSRGNIRMVTAAICRGIRQLPDLVRWRVFR